MGNRYRVILADDHVLVRHGLKLILTENPDLEIAAEVGDGLELLNVLQKINPDLIILDVSMPNLRGCRSDSRDSPRPAECESADADHAQGRRLSLPGYFPPAQTDIF